MIKDFYSYTQEKDDEDIISYSFLTSNGSLYFVYFDPYHYVKYVNDYPNLLNPGFGFGFGRAHKASGVWRQDALIGETIAKIVSDFIAEYGNEVVLLYHCEYLDGKQKARNKVFHDWYNDSQIKDAVIKKGLVVNLFDREGIETDYFVGYLTSCHNKNSTQVEEEFSVFAEKLVTNK